MNRLRISLLVFIGLSLSSVFVVRYVKKSSIPPKISQSHALRDLYRLAGTKDLTITPLKGGLSESTLYKVDSRNESFVIRFIGHRSMNDRLREINAQMIASKEGWSPTVYTSDINEGWIIMNYIKPKNLTAADRENEKTYEALGKLLQRIHTSTDFLPGKSILTEIEELMNNAHNQGKIPSSIDYNILKDIIESVKKTYPRMLTPTHRDLNPNNILFSDYTIFIIDFENAAQDDPFYDLATVGIFYLFNPYHEAAFLNAYFNRAPTSQEYAYYQEMKQLALLFYGFNFLDFVPQKMIQSTSVTIKPFVEMLQDVGSGGLNLADHADQLKFAISILQEAINQYKRKTE